jgi:ethanolamine utilization cobalamin adenosyltransferase
MKFIKLKKQKVIQILYKEETGKLNRKNKIKIKGPIHNNYISKKNKKQTKEEKTWQTKPIEMG